MLLNRIYATPADLANYLGLDEAPADAQRLIARASEAIDDNLITAVYAVDEDGYPTDPIQREAVQLATCAVIEWWGEERGTGDETGAASVWNSVSAGAVSLSRTVAAGGASGGTGSTQVRAGALPPRALSYLRRSKLLGGVVFTR
jgi:hypothetical protein